MSYRKCLQQSLTCAIDYHSLVHNSLIARTQIADINGSSKRTGGPMEVVSSRVEQLAQLPGGIDKVGHGNRSCGDFAIEALTRYRSWRYQRICEHMCGQLAQLPRLKNLSHQEAD
eukprot:1160739-Pelagomonas_calceolata.AAC.11